MYLSVFPRVLKRKVLVTEDKQMYFWYEGFLLRLVHTCTHVIYMVAVVTRRGVVTAVR